MDRAEFWDRSRQAAAQRWDALLAQAGRQPPSGLHAVPSGRLGRFFIDPGSAPQLITLLRERLPEQAAALVERARRILEHRFDLLGYEDLDYGKVIDWHLDRVHGKSAPRQAAFRVKYLDFEQVGDAKVTWELNRHQHLVVLAKAYLLTGDERFAHEIFAQWYSWQEQNPYAIGINWASTLEVAFRSLSWLWVRALLEGDPVVPAAFPGDLSRALALSGRHIERYLSTYFSPNTHLLGEAAALFCIGTSCPEAVRSERWRELGWRVVEQETRKQVREDGFYFEQSAYYHVYALEFFLHCGLLAAKSDAPPSAEYAATVERMCSALALLSRTGITASFGDDDGGRVLDGQRNRAANLTEPLAVAAVVFGRGDFKHLAKGLNEDVIWLLGSEGVEQFDVLKPVPPQLSSAALEASGFYVMASAEPVPQQLILDAGPQGAGTGGHGHADALSAQLYYGGRALLQDRGTLEYVGGTSDRADLRGTASHNTMTVDGVGQSQPQGPFAWDRLTKTHHEIWVAGEHFDLFRASHDGYAHRGVTHQRWVFYLHQQFWLIRDVAEGQGIHELELEWHLGAALEPTKREGRFLDASGLDCGLEIVGCTGEAWLRRSTLSWWSPVYGRREASWTLRCSLKAQLSAECATVLVPLANRNQSAGTLRSLNEIDGGEVRGYTYEVGTEKHGFFFRQRPGPWMHASWASDAEFVYYRSGSTGLRDLYFYNGSYVEAGGKRVVSARGIVSYCQLVTDRDATRVIAPAKDQIILHRPLNQASMGRDVALSGALSGERNRADR
jgi:hypothetical protein